MAKAQPERRKQLFSQVEACDRDVEAAHKGSDDHQLLVALEKSLHLRRKLFAEDSPEIMAASQKVCQGYNRVATSLLAEGELKAARQLLQRAEEVAKEPLCCAMTWNNLACFFRKSNKNRSAVAYLEQALAVEERYGHSAAAQTHLNLCATLSQLQRHSEALQQAQRALVRIYEALAPRLCEKEEEVKLKEEVPLLCVAYHNQGVEQEFLRCPEAALQAYAQGTWWACKFLGTSHQLAKLLHHAAESAKAKVPSDAPIMARVEPLLSPYKPGKPYAVDRPFLGLLSPHQGLPGAGDKTHAVVSLSEAKRQTSA
ncbi:unnamed protein product [Effrenium voratum]|nr:unnamed protein product [Effrenium voratum]